jgi:mRNA interferase HigB
LNNQEQTPGMVLIGKNRLDECGKKYKDASSWIENWIVRMESTIFRSPQDIKNRFPSASFLAENIVIFNVKGNKYRLEVQIAYQKSKINIIWIGTHQEYDKRNAKR